MAPSHWRRVAVAPSLWRRMALHRPFRARASRHPKPNARIGRVRCESALFVGCRTGANSDAKACVSDRRLEACRAPLESCIEYDSDFESILTKPRWTALHESRKGQDRAKYSLEELTLDGSDFRVIDWNGRYGLHPPLASASN